MLGTLIFDSDKALAMTERINKNGPKKDGNVQLQPPHSLKQAAQKAAQYPRAWRRRPS